MTNYYQLCLSYTTVAKITMSFQINGALYVSYVATDTQSDFIAVGSLSLFTRLESSGPEVHRSDEALFYKRGSQGNQWKQAIVTLPAFSTSFRVTFLSYHNNPTYITVTALYKHLHWRHMRSYEWFPETREISINVVKLAWDSNSDW